jgi:hypothetical protein
VYSTFQLITGLIITFWLYNGKVILNTQAKRMEAVIRVSRGGLAFHRQHSAGLISLRWPK